MAKLAKYDPFVELKSLQRRFFGDALQAPSTGAHLPTTDVYTKDNKLFVEAHIPNFDKDDVDIQVDGDNLIISAEHRNRELDKDKKYVIRESASSFYRSITLPERADRDGICADLEEGVLCVSIPLAPMPEPRKIEIDSKS